jgi:hypothetical protein
LRIVDVPVSRLQFTLAGTQLGVDTASGAVEAAAAYEGQVVSRCSATVTAPSSHDRGGEPGEASRACSCSRPPHRRHHRRSGRRPKSPAALARRHTRLEHGANPAMRGIRSMSYRAVPAGGFGGVSGPAEIVGEFWKTFCRAPRQPWCQSGADVVVARVRM